MGVSQWIYSFHDPELVREIQDQTGLSRPAALALASEGVDKEELDGFLNPRLGMLSDPYTLPGVRKATARLWEAVSRQEHILIHGDYDADGITSTVLLAEILQDAGGVIETFLPNRLENGYGLTSDTVRKACSEHHSLLVTVDCGITSVDAVEFARSLGIDVIITDHHEPGESLPDALAVVNSRLGDTPAELRDLAGVGVAFKLAHAFIKMGREQGLGGFDTDLKEVLDLVALGTIADIVSLRHENRILVKAGLAQLSRQLRPGVRALCEITNINQDIRSPDIAFRLAPRLNAAGRMSDASLATELLSCDSIVEANRLAKSLDAENKKRQNFELEVLKNAEEQIKSLYDPDHHAGLIAWGEDWHQGVLGIVASSLTRSYNRPCIVLTRDRNGLLCGSGRSVKDVDLVRILSESEHLLTRYGGHPMAAGLALEPEKIDAFRESFHDSVRRTLPPEKMHPILDVCGEVFFEEIETGYLHDLPRLEPFGAGNQEPVFVATGVCPRNILPAGSCHSRGKVADSENNTMDFIAFQQSPDDFPSPPWDIAFRGQFNTFRGQNRPQLQIIEVRRHGR
ncbi:MAG: single-stranded-DNA-specific exonuclease RecJ [Lentisphaeria bacterium]